MHAQITNFNLDPSTLDGSGTVGNQNDGTYHGKEVVSATELDKQETEKIKRILRVDYKQYETSAESMKKRKILGKLQQIVEEWV